MSEDDIGEIRDHQPFRSSIWRRIYSFFKSGSLFRRTYEEASHLEQTRGRVPLYAILPKNKYLNDVFRVKISKPIDLPDRVPSAMDHGFVYV